MIVLLIVPYQVLTNEICDEISSYDDLEDDRRYWSFIQD